MINVDLGKLRKKPIYGKKKRMFISKRGVALLTAGGLTVTLFSCCSSKNKHGNNNEVDNTETTTIIETTEKPIETEETIVTTIESIMSKVTTTPMVEEPEEVTTTVVDNDAVIYANETVTTVTEAEPVATTTKVETTAAPIVTTVAQTTKAPVTTTVVTTEAPVVANAMANQEYAYKDIDLARFEELTQNLVDEFKRVGLVKAKGKKYTKADLYSTVYCYNCDYIDEDLKQQLIAKNYIADDVASVLVDAASPRDAIMTDTETKAILNTNLDEVYFGLNYFKNDETVFFQMFETEISEGMSEEEIMRTLIFGPDFFNIYNTETESVTAIYNVYDYNSTNKVHNRVTEKLKTIDMDEYFEMRDRYLKKHPINTSAVKFASHSDDVPKQFIGIDSYQFDDFVDISVAINDPEARDNVKKTLGLVFEGSFDNSRSVNSLNNFSNFYMGDKQHTSLTDCGAGATFAMNTYIYAYSDFLGKNPYKNLQGFAKDEHQYEQIKLRYNRIVNDSQELNDVVRVYESCSKQLTR